jgi:hypothetical protein
MISIYENLLSYINNHDTLVLLCTYPTSIILYRLILVVISLVLIFFLKKILILFYFLILFFDIRFIRE